MIGLMVLGALALYLIVSIWVTKKASNWAKANNKKPWVWGGLAAFVMYNLVFWNLIPTLVMHKYYCATQAGFWVYKTPEQWVKENPKVMEMLKQSLSPKAAKSSDTQLRVWLNQRFYMDIKRAQISHGLMIEQKMFFDAKNNELIVKSVNFYRGIKNVVVSSGSIDEWRQAFSISWGNRECGDVGKSPTDNFRIHAYQFWKSGENK